MQDLDRGMTAFSWGPRDTSSPPTSRPRGRKNSVRTEMWLRTGGRGYFEHHGEWGEGVGQSALPWRWLQAMAHLHSARGWGDGSVSDVLDL